MPEAKRKTAAKQPGVRKAPPRGGKKTSPVTIAAREKAAKALELRKGGDTFEEIAKTLGYNSKQSAFDAVRRALALITREPAQELITLDLERLDAMWGVNFARAKDGDIEALKGCIRIMERRAKMLGLDATEKAEIFGPGGAPLMPTVIELVGRIDSGKPANPA